MNKPRGKDYQPKRLALSIDPPAIVIEYLDAQSGKLYHHTMKLGKVLARTQDQAKIVRYLRGKHSPYFTQQIKDSQL
jgi:hypothetical protein